MRADLRVEVRGPLPSTQDEVRGRLFAGEDVDRLVVRASAQTAGRGRQQREWHSGDGGSYQTAAFRDGAGNFRSGRVPIAVATGIAESFGDASVSVGLKWPNDIFLAPRVDRGRLSGKLGGVLCEHVKGHLLVGVGVNVRNRVPPGGAAIGSLEAHAVSELVLDGIVRGLAELVDDRLLPERFRRYDVLRGMLVTTREAGTALTGTAAGISDGGCLLIATAAGVVETCSGRIERIEPAAGIT